MKKFMITKIAGAGLMASLMLFAVQVQAQDNPGPKFGIKGGVNLAQLFVDQPNAEDENMKIGYHVGLFGKIPVTDFLAVQPELLYTNTGAKVTYGGSDLANLLGIQQGEVRFNLNYIQLPVLLAANIGAFNVHVGPYASYLVGANVKDLKSADLNTNDVTDLNTDDFNRVDYGLAGGIGIDLKGFTIGARYNYGLREIGNSGLAGRLTNNSRNSVAQLFIGFGF
jgi:hypothetical protein